MPTPLRAFLIVGSINGDPEVHVFHALEEVIRAWERREDESLSAVFHVGFDRRPARAYSSILREFSGRLLLTEAGKSALPSSFKSSTNFVALDDKSPIFLALEGWGYSEPDPEPNPFVSTGRPFTDWVAEYIVSEPGSESVLTAAGVFDEATYLKSECLLDYPTRAALGNFRFKSRFSGDPDDVIAFVEAAPPWLLARDLAEIPLTVRLTNIFNYCQFLKVGDISKLTLHQLMRLPNFGKTSLRHLNDALSDALKEGPPLRMEELAASSGNSLLENIDLTLAKCAAREAEILRRRMGLSQEPQTLAEIGVIFKVTRERIRQIEERAVSRIVRDEIWDDILREKLVSLLKERTFPIPLLGIEALDRWFEGVASQRHAIRYALENMSASGVSLVRVDDVEYLSLLSQVEWDKHLDAARRLLASKAGEHWPRSRCEYVVRSLIEDRGGEFRNLLWEVASRGCHFAGDADDPELIRYGRGAEQIVEAVLYDSETPLHYLEIGRLASIRAGREIDERRAHNAAAEVGLLFGAGTYGLMKHLHLSPLALEEIADEASEVVLEGPPERQWHTSELLEAIRQRGSADTSIGKHVLDIALKQQGQLRSLGRMIWVAPGGDVDALRVEVRQAQIAILQKAGRPLTTSELRQRLIAVRGLNELMQLSQGDPIIKLESSLWGLNDRDVPIKREHQKHFLDSVYSVLSTLGRPAHVSECRDLLGDQLSGRTMISLVQTDRRFKTTADRKLDLR